MVTAEQLAVRKQEIARSRDLMALVAHLTEQAAPVLERMPPIPREKALLSSDGGICPEDGAPLAFDPWSPDAHRCPRCGRTFGGERHDRNWARYQHLWLAERAAHLAALGALADHDAAASRAAELLQAYAHTYWQYPNRDNVLGPSRLFFSTYLESISNRQTWNNTALAAIAAWFEDEALAQRAIEGPTGLLAHLLRGFGRDGMWYEGENYHLFALRGLLTGAAW